MAYQEFTLENLAILLNQECDRMPFSTLKPWLNCLVNKNTSQSEPLKQASVVECLSALQQQLPYREMQNEFISQETFEKAQTSYESFIFEQAQVPTRNNWHDFFNGLIWLQFPRTKRYFNEQHTLDIQRLDVETQDTSPLHKKAKGRSAVRDRLTHFDECGLVLFTDQVWLENALDAHEWQQIFVNKALYWDSNIVPLVFGHALWEMLLNPFIGLTAKATVVCLPSATLKQINQLKKKSSDEKLIQMFDELLLSHLTKNKLIFQTKPWKPLPLLGIPSWSNKPQNDAFYANKSYFMPKSKK